MSEPGADGGGVRLSIFASLVIALGSAAIAALTLLFSVNKTDRDETRALEKRLCRLEARAGTGDCKL